MGNQFQRLGRIEPAAFRCHLYPALGDQRQAIEPRSVGLRRRMDNRVARRQRRHIGKIAEDGDEQVAMAEHGALGFARGAGSVEEPRQIIGSSVLQCEGRLFLERLILLIMNGNDGFQGRKVRYQRGQFIGKLCCCEGEAAFGVFQDIAKFINMQLGIHRNGDKPGIRGRWQQCPCHRRGPVNPDRFLPSWQAALLYSFSHSTGAERAPSCCSIG